MGNIFCGLPDAYSLKTSSPIRFINVEDLKRLGYYPRFPDNQDLTKDLAEVDRSNALMIFISHCWLRGTHNAAGWDGKPHPDTANHDKFKLTIEGIEKAWKIFAPGMQECYVWIDFGCIDQDGDPAGELKQLNKIMAACDCVFTPILDPEWRSWGSAHFQNDSNWYRLYNAPLWRDGSRAYLNRAWCRMEMLYAANLDLLDYESSSSSSVSGSSSSSSGLTRASKLEAKKRIDKFAAGLKTAAARNFRPHLLYGTRESEMAGVSPIMLSPLHNSLVDVKSPATGDIAHEKDRAKIAELMSALEIRRVEESYEGDRNAQGLKHGHGKFTWIDGKVYEGQWVENEMHGVGQLTSPDCSSYDGEFVRGLKHGTGTSVYANGDTFSGHWRHDKRSGSGTYTSADGSVLVGQFMLDHREGLGTHTSAVGVYTGMYEADKRHGQGKFEWRTGAVYEGQYERGVRSGQGAMKYSDGSSYTGQWKGDKKHGSGREVSAHEEVRTGIWEKGVFIAAVP